jgi:hypothetical protein
LTTRCAFTTVCDPTSPSPSLPPPLRQHCSCTPSRLLLSLFAAVRESGIRAVCLSPFSCPRRAVLIMRVATGKLFPYAPMHQWLSYGGSDKAGDSFSKREFSFTLKDDIYIRSAPLCPLFLILFLTCICAMLILLKLDTLLAVMSIDQSRTMCGRFLSYSSADDWKAGTFVFLHAHVFVHACKCMHLLICNSCTTCIYDTIATPICACA